MVEDSLRRLTFDQVIGELNLLRTLEEFSPVVIGTPPLGIEIESSDIDIACCSSALENFKDVATSEFSNFENFSFRETTHQKQKSLIIQFRSHDWDIELFCQTIPTQEQWGVRHFLIEKRILSIQPELREAVRKLKEQGLKTEPAFAAVLGIHGAPYSSILEFEPLNNKELENWISEHWN